MSRDCIYPAPINYRPMTGIELSRRFFFEASLPILQTYFRELSNRAAAGLVAGGFDSGCGSEIAGFDDDISRDQMVMPSRSRARRPPIRLVATH